MGTRPELFLPGWPVGSFDSWDRLTSRAQRLTARAGTGLQFDLLLAEVRRLIDSGRIDLLSARLPERRFARAVVTVWSEDRERARASMTPAVVSLLVDSQTPRPSRLLVAALASMFLTHFDRLDSWSPGLFEATSTAVERAVTQVPVRRTRAPALPPPPPPHGGTPVPPPPPPPNPPASRDIVDAFRYNSEFLLDIEAPRAVAQGLRATETALGDWLRVIGINGHVNGRYGIRVREALFLETIRAADHTRAEGLGFLAELTSKTVVESLGAGGTYFGHQILVAMTDKPDVAPCNEWLDAIVKIGGDPRLQRQALWHRWWEPLPQAARDKAVRWMSVEDLRLFLTAVENHGLITRNADLQRMFPARKTFLWGLYESGLVRESRIFLGSGASVSVKRQLGARRTDATHLTQRSDTAIVFLDCGDFHIVEGSHSFKLWVYAGRPVARLLDRSRRNYSPDELIKDIPELHAQQHPAGRRAHVGITHYATTWQHAALKFLIETLGAPVDPQRLLTPEDYLTLKHRFGLPVRGATPLRS
ncbi:EH signature domain-containing protein [Oerskovia gallyi]|uniref:Zorya protein ZorC EH domain-containing protein n=1 Tax=Oerskovia gallyi TaxID=2762226 RepID=A0ABR8UWU5_9CELL|nr:EH signature domain-containing protein [Oerskovia gallyi]MBD7996993.1 hypothetical protein [Oerskovia gallyi]